MIQIDVADHSATVCMRSVLEITQYHAFTNAQCLDSYFLVMGGTSTSSTYDLQVGNPPEKIGPAFGVMRDKAVRHLNATGHVSLPGATLQYGFENGRPYAQRPNGTKLCFDQVVAWGTNTTIERSVVGFGPQVILGNTYTQDSSFSQHEARFISSTDNRMIIHTYRETGADYRNGTLHHPRRKTAYIYSYLRYYTAPLGWRIYQTSYIARNGSDYTGAEIEAALASIPTTPTGVSVGYTDLVLTQAGVSLSNFVDALSIAVGKTLSTMQELIWAPEVDWGQLAVECAAQLKVVDENVLLLFIDVADYKNFRLVWKTMLNGQFWKESILPAVSRAWSALGSGRFLKTQDVREIFRPGASTYLSGKYGVMPSVSDIGRLYSGVCNISTAFRQKQRIHSRRVTSIDVPDSLSATHTAVLTVQCSKYPSDLVGKAMEFISMCKSWGLYPEAQNLWDIIPFSFVVDWFVQIGDYFETVQDAYNIRDYFPIEYAILSQKVAVGKSITSILPQYVATGEVQFSYYTRGISRELPLPTPSLEAEFRAQNHGFEALALWIQRM